MRGRPPASVRDEHQQQPRREWKQRRGTSASHQCHYRRTDHDYNETRCSQRREPQLDAEEPGRIMPIPASTSHTPTNRKNEPDSIGICFVISAAGRTNFALQRTERGALTAPE
jgi:hypothetical protein